MFQASNIELDFFAYAPYSMNLPNKQEVQYMKTLVLESLF